MVMTGWRNVLKIHPAAELFPLMSPEELKELGEDIKKNGPQVPFAVYVDKDDNVSLLDGRNRLDAMELVGFTISPGEDRWKPPEVRDPDGRGIYLEWHRQADPYAYVVSINVRRRHLTTAQKGELIDALLKANPERSDRATAAIAHVSDKTVNAKREKLEGRAEIPHVERRADTKGRSQPATKPARPTPAPTAAVAAKPFKGPPVTVAYRDDLVAPPSDDDNAVTMRIPRKPQGAAAAIIRHWARDDIRALVAALQKFLDTPVMQ
jgi:hypothetical protein